MIIQGKNSVREAVRAKKTIDKIYILKTLVDNESKEIINEIKGSSYSYEFVDKIILDRIATNKSHQGFVASISEFVYSTVDDMIELASKNGEQLFLVILDGIDDPQNFASIVRSCECAGVTGIIIQNRNACQVTDTVVRISAGAIYHVKIARVVNINNEIDRLKKMGVWVYGMEANGQSIYRTNLKGDLALVIGSEGNGISQLTRKKCDAICSLPMFGKVNSLNASNACAIALYEAVRQRN
jgi:23S rRNA (guanosine2251-2'-O)-methyltransferase